VLVTVSKAVPAAIAWALKDVAELPTTFAISGALEVKKYGATPPVTWNVNVSVTCALADAGCVCSRALAGQVGCADGMVMVAVAVRDWLSSTVTVAIVGRTWIPKLGLRYSERILAIK